MTRLISVLVLVFGLFSAAIASASAEGEVAQSPRILAIGDSLMAWHSLTGFSIPDVIASELDEPTANRSIGGARMLFNLPLVANLGMRISNQAVEGQWDWIVMNGGGNDLWFGCGCAACDAKLDKLISTDGKTGEIPRLVNEFREQGANVLYFGYLRSPGFGSPIENCLDEGDELDTRIANFAQATEGFYFLSNADLVPSGDLSYHALDRIHPSLKASKAIGKRVAEFIRKTDKNR